MEMKKWSNTLKVYAFILAIIMAACVKDEIDVDKISDQIYWNPKFGVPVAYGSLTIKDLIEELDSTNSIKEDANHFLSMMYTNTVLSATAENILQIEDQQFSEVLLESHYNLPAFPTQDTIKLTRTNDYVFDFNYGEIIDSVKMKAGTMVFHVSSSYKYRGTLEIEVPKLTRNKQPLKILVDINTSDGTFTTTQNYDLEGYKFELEHPNVTDNRISYDYTAKLINSGSGVSVGDNITITIDFIDIAFSSLYGYIGHRQLINTLSEFSVPLFTSVSNPNLQFTDPLLRIRSTNSFGLPASVELYNTSAHSENDNITVPITFTPGVNPFLINHPEKIGEYAKDTAEFDRTTTNLDEALEIGPNHIYYGIRSFANPNGRTFNYITDSSKVKIEMDIELPLDMRTTMLEFRDTLEMDLSDIGDNADKIKSLLLHSSFENGMPIDLNLQVILADENYNPIDTLFSPQNQPVVKSGVLDQQGKVTSPTTKDIDITFIDTDIEPLENVRHALVKAGLITVNNGTTFVKFYSNYTLKVHFGVQTELEVKED